MKKILFLILILISSTSFASSGANMTQQEINKNIVINFYNKFFNDHKVDEASIVVANNYKQHNPDVPDGKELFTSFFKQFFIENPNSKAKIVRVASDGDLVWIHVHSTLNPEDKGEAVVDIFKLEDGKIIEHWDVIQKVPEVSENNNTMF